jgi:hypothetical protein
LSQILDLAADCCGHGFGERAAEVGPAGYCEGCTTRALPPPPDRGVMEWGAAELAHLERNANLFRARLSA